ERVHVEGSWLEVDLDRACGHRHASAHHLTFGVLDCARAQIAHRTGSQAPDAGVADAHAAPVWQQRARTLSGRQQRRACVGLDLLAAREEADPAAVAAQVGRDESGPEALLMQPVADALAL